MANITRQVVNKQTKKLLKGVEFPNFENMHLPECTLVIR